ncbi:MAG: class I SAM-dependent methyltransferase, partial [Devosia sp.]
MSSITQGQAQQYSDSSKLAARARLHQEFSVSDVPWFPWVMSKLPLKSGDQVLDIGCGPGWFWSSAASDMPQGMHLTLTDQSPGMVKEATDRCAALPFTSVKGETANASDMPFADQTFDVVIAMHMLYHLPDQRGAIAEMHRVLKPGGTLAVTTNGVANLAELYELTTLLGSDPVDPAAVAFGYDKATQLIEQQFGNVRHAVHPATLQVTDPDVVYLALTSYPPGDSADQSSLDALRGA